MIKINVVRQKLPKRAALVGIAMLLASILTTCDMFQAGLGARIDVAYPTVSVSSPSNGSYLRGTVTLTGAASDDVSVASVVVTVEINSKTVGTTTATLKDGAWSASIDTSALSSGSDSQADIVVTATDTSKKASSIKLVDYFDNTAPTFTSMSPSADELANTDYTYALSETTTISGSMKDSLGMAKTVLTVGSLSYTDSTHPAAWSVEFDASKYYDSSKLADSSSGYGALNGATYVETGLYSAPFSVVGTDLAGNASTAVSGTLYINCDGAPIVSITSPANSIYPKLLYPNTTASTASSIVAPGKTIAFLVTDMDGIDASQVYAALALGSSVGDSTLAPGSLSGCTIYKLASGNLKCAATYDQVTLADGTIVPTRAVYQFTAPTTVGEYLVLIHAADYAANKLSASSAERYVPQAPASGKYTYSSLFISNSNPTVTISSPTDGSYLSTLSASGTIVDDMGAAYIDATVSPTSSGGTAEFSSGWVSVSSSGSKSTTWSYSSSTALADGSYQFTVSGKNIIGATSATSVSATFTVDSTAPAVSVNAVTSSSTNDYVSGIVAIGGTASDSGSAASGVSKVQFLLDSTAGSWTTANGTTSWSGNLDLDEKDSSGNYRYGEGQHTLYSRAIDKAGNVSANASTAVLVDRASPRATETSHTASLVTTNESVSFAGVADDASVTSGRAAASAVLSYSLNGGSSVPASDLSWTPSTGAWSWTLPKSLGDGLYTISLTVTDVAGKTASVTRTVRLDTTPPTIVVSSPSSKEWTAKTSFAIKGSASDSGVGFDGTDDVEYRINGGSWTSLTLDGTAWAKTLSLSSEGSYELEVRSTDALGNQSTSGTIVFYYDLYYPTLSESAIGSTAMKYAKASFSLSGSVSDTNALASSSPLTISVDGGSAVSLSVGSDGTWSYSYSVDASTHGQDGTHSFVLTATDVAGKQTPLTRTVLVDTIAPIIAIAAPASAEIAPSSNYTVSGSASDSGSGLSLVKYYLVKDGATAPSWSIASGTTSWSGSWDFPSEGHYTVYARAVDKLENETDATVGFYYDIAAPTLTESGVAGSANASIAYSDSRNSDLSFFGSASDSDALASTNALTVLIDNSTTKTIEVGSGGAWSYSYAVDASSHSNDGTHSFVFTAKDIAGRTTTLARTITIDTRAPSVSAISAPLEYSSSSSSFWLSGTTSAASGSASDSGSGASGVSAVYYKVLSASASAPSYTSSDASWKKATGTTSWSASADLSSLGEGEFTLYVAAVDAVGNIGSALSRSFGVDQSAPTIAETHASTFYAPNGFTLSGTIADTNSLKGISVSEEANGSSTVRAVSVTTTPSTLPGSTSATFVSAALPIDGATDGQYKYTLIVTDAAGKTAYVYRTVKIDTTAPELSITTTLPAWNTSSSLSIGGSASDSASGSSGVSTVSYQLDGGGTKFATWTDSSSAGDNSTGTWTAKLTGLSEGTHSLVVTATDYAGNSKTLSAVSFGVDLSSPSLSLDSVTTPITSTNYSSFSGLSGTVSDTNALASADPVTVSYAKNGGASSSAAVTYSSSAGTWSCSPFSVASGGTTDGSYVFTITATDVAGNQTTKTKTIVIDTTLPLVSLDDTTKAKIASYVSGTLAISGTASDSSGIAKVEYQLDSSSGTWTTASSYETWTGSLALSSATETSHTLYIRATDAVGNLSEVASASVMVDRAKPEITETRYSSAAYVTTNTALAFEGVADDAVITAGREAATLELSYGISDSGSATTLSLSSSGSTENFAWNKETGAWSWTMPSDLADGSYTITVTATDVAGKTASVERNVVLDTTGPELSVTNLASGDSIESSSFTLKGTAIDSGVGLASLYCSIDGGSSWTDITSKASWSVDLKISGSEGARSLLVRALDKNKNATTLAISFNYDASVPSLTESGIAGSGNEKKTSYSKSTNTASLVLSGTASDTNALASSDPVTVSYTKDGGSAISATLSFDSSAGTWTCSPFTVAADGSTDGSYLFTITATDIVGRTTQFTRTVVLDLTAPTISDLAVSPSDGETVSSSSITASCLVSDSGSGLASPGVSFALTGGSAASATKSSLKWASSLSLDSTHGAKTLVVTSVDAVGNSSTSTLVFYYDTAAPTLTESGVSSSEAAVYKSSQFRLSGDVSDDYALADSDPVAITYTKDGTTQTKPSVTVTSGSWSCAPFDLDASGHTTDGTYVFTITATDKVGKTTTLTRKVIVDTSAPEVTPAEMSSWLTGTTGSLSGTASDNISLAGVYYTIESATSTAPAFSASTWTLAGGTTNWSSAISLITVGEGVHVVYYAALDAAGNVSAIESTTLKIDLAKPTLTESVIGTDTLTYKTGGVTLAGMVADTNGISGVKISYTEDGGTEQTLSATVSGTTWNASSDLSDDGLYVVTIVATDGAGQTTTVTRNVMIDTAKPEVTVSSPSDGTYTTVDSLTVKGLATDGSGSGVKSVSYSLDGSASTSANGVSSWTIPLSSLTSEGAHIVTVTATDKAGNAGTASLEFYYDKSAPVLSETSLGSSDQVIKTSGFSLSGAASDTDSLASVKVSVSVGGGSATTVLSGSYSGTESQGWSYAQIVDASGHTNDGSYVYTIVATDIAGRTTTLTRNVVIDTTAPTISADALSSAYYESSLTISGTASDTTSGLKSVAYQVDSDTGTWVSASGTTTWNKTLSLSSLSLGSHAIYYLATDKAGLTAESSATFTIDRSAPTISESEYSGTVYKNADFSVTVTLGDDYKLATSAPVTAGLSGASGVSLGSLSENSGGSDTSQTWVQAVKVGSGATGTVSLSFTVMDSAGRTATLTRTVIIDTQAPTVTVTSPASTVKYAKDTDITLSLEGNLSESTIDTVEAQLDGTAAGGWKTVTYTNGMTDWSYSLTLSTLSEGSHTVYLRATDKAGNVSGTYGSYAFTLDKNDPTLTETGVGAGATGYTNGDFTLKGVFSDSVKVDESSLSVSVTREGVLLTGLTPTIAKSATQPTTGAQYDWELPITVTSGIYVATINVTDASGRSAAKITRSVSIDTGVPTVSITTPSSSGYISDSIVVVRGLSNDAESSVKSIQYVYDNASPVESDWQSIDGAANWRVDLPSLSAGSHTLKVRAVDLAGNVSSTADRTFMVDREDPTLTETKQGAAGQTSLTLQTKNAAIGLGGSISDDNGYASPSLKAVESFTAAGSVTSTTVTRTITPSSGTWSDTISASGDGVYLVTYTATDAAARTSALTRTIVLDTKAPSLSASSPSAGSYVTSDSCDIVVSSGDTNGVGVSTVEYSFDSGATKTWTALSSGVLGWTASSVSLGSSEGSRTLYLRSTDAVGNEATTDVVFYYDQSAPDLGSPTLTIGGSSYSDKTKVYYAAESIKLSGSVSDTNALAAFEIQATKDGVKQDSPVTTIPAAGSYSYMKAFDSSNHTEDGTWTYTVWAKDIAGRPASWTWTVIVDTTDPIVNVDALSGYQNSSMRIGGTASDANLSKVEYQIDATTDGNWKTAGSSSVWTTTISDLSGYADGSHALNIRATDYAGRSKTESTSFKIDRGEPTIGVTTVDGIAYDTWTASTKYRNSSLDVIGTSSDANGIKKLEISYDGGLSYADITTSVSATLPTSDSGEVSWSQTVPIASWTDDGLKTVYVRATDQAGYQSTKSFKVYRDTTAPTFSVSNLVSDQLITTTSFAVTGGISDNGGSGLSGGSATIGYRVGTSGAYTPLTLGSSSWSGTLAPLSEGLDQTIELCAIDALGNASDPIVLTGIDVDMALPETTTKLDGVIVGSDTSYATGAFTLSGTATDTNGILSVTIAGPGVGTGDTTTITNLSAGVWSVSGISPTSDGTNIYTITVKDGAGREQSYTRKVLYDTKDPTFGLSTDLSAWQHTTAVAISGTAGDDSTGSGLSAIQYSLDSGATWTDLGTLSLTNWSGTITIPEGASNNLGLRSKDKAGLTSAEVSLTIKVDATEPAFTETTPVSVASTNTPLIFTGPISDNIALASSDYFTVTSKLNGVTKSDGTTTLSDGTWKYVQNVDTSSSHADDGAWELVFTATDSSGLTKTISKLFTVDTTGPSLTISDPVSADILYPTSPKYTFTGSVKDTGVGLNTGSVKYLLSSATGTPTESVTPNGTNWTVSDLALGSEGTKVFTITASDTLGNATTASVQFYYDLAKPVISETKVNTTDTVYRSDDFVLSGVWTETNSLSSIAISYQKDGSTGSTLLATLTPNTNGSDVDWSYTVGVDTDNTGTVDTTGIQDGSYVFSIIATDATGRTATLTRTVVIDTVKPTVTAIATPASGLSSSDQDYWLSGTTGSISGTASDGQSLANVYYRIEGAASTTPTFPTDGTTTGWTKAGGTTDWSASVSLSTVGEGLHTVYVVAVDAAGNSSAVLSRDFGVDLAKPNATETNYGTALITSNKAVSFTGQGNDWGTATSGRTAASVSLSYTKDGGSSVSASDLAWTQLTGVWSWTLPAYTEVAESEIVVGKSYVIRSLGSAPDFMSIGASANAIGVHFTATAKGTDSGTVSLEGEKDGLYVITLTVVDDAQKSSTVTRTVQIDTTAPTVSISTPGASEYVESNAISISGTAKDTGGVGFDGTADVEYSINNIDWTTLSLSGINWSKSSVDFGSTEGTKTLYVRSTDALGNTSASSVSFYYDLAKPELSETTIGTTDTQYTNTNITLKGTWAETNSLATIAISYKKDAATTSTSLVTQTINAKTDTTTPTKDWSYTTSGLAEGKYVFTIVATDAANRTASVTRTVMIDTTAPDTIDTAVASTATSRLSTDLSGWHKTSSIAITGLAADTLGSANSGISKVQYSLDYPATSATWVDLTGTSNWNGTISVPDGSANTLYLRSLDTAGNYSAVSTPVTIKIDTTAPDFDITSPATTPVVNGNSDLSFEITATDLTSGPASASASLSATTWASVTSTSTFSASGVATITVPAASIASLSAGNKKIYFKVKDAAGNETVAVGFYITVDKTAPTGSVSSHADGATVNKRITVSGTASDANLSSSSGTFWVWKPTTPSASDASTVGAWVAASTGTVSGTTSWSVTNFNTANYAQASYDASSTTGFQLLVGYLVSDVAGNTAYITRMLAVDQDSDKPIITLSNLDLSTVKLDSDGNSYSILKSTKVIYGSISDDDGSITSLKIKNALSDSWTDISNPSQGFSYTVTGSDGKKQLYMQITDAAGTVFTTEAATSAISVAADTSNNLFTANGHGLSAGNAVYFTGTTLPTGISTGTAYYVLASSLKTNSFQVVATYADALSSSASAITLSGTPSSDLAVSFEAPLFTKSSSAYFETPALFKLGTKTPTLSSSDIEVDTTTSVAFDDAVTLTANKSFGGSSTGKFLVRFEATSENKFATATVSVEGSSIESSATLKNKAVAIGSDLSTFTLANHGFADGTALYLTATTMPTLSSGTVSSTTPYYVIASDTNTFKLASAKGVASTVVTFESADSDVYVSTLAASTAGYWVFDTDSAIDVTQLSSGSYNLAITVTDELGLQSTITKTILVDNAAPTISVTSHTMNEQVTGDVVLNGTSDDGTGSGVASVKYHVGTCSDLSTLAASAWTTLSTQLSWAINFTSAASNVITTTASYANSTYATETSTGSNVWILPIYLRATDKAGNVQDYTFYLNVDPDGDKPTVSVSYPASGTTLGGNIRVFGSATDNVSVASVWMEIDTDNDGDYDATDAAALAAVMSGSTHVYGADTSSLASGFAIDGTASWSRTINSAGEFNAPGTTVASTTITSGVRYKIVTVDGTDYTALGAASNTAGVEFTATANGASSAGTGTVTALTNLIRFRVRACDNNGTYGTWSAFRTIKIDNKAPKIGSTTPLKLVQYNDAGLTTVSAEQTYVADMYIRGVWYLVGSVEDESGIKAISVSGSATGTLSSQSAWFVQGTAVGSYYNYTLKIPVGKATSDTSCGAQTYTIYVEDASDPTGTTTQTVTLNYDNKAPVAVTPTHGGTTISTSNLVVQSNNTYTFASTVAEDGSSDSGFNRLVFFFMRQKADGTNKRLYNPMISVNSSQATTDVTGNRTYLSNLTWDTGDVPRLAITDATRTSEDSLTHSSIVGNYNVRVGGLVRIAGVDRLIKSVDRTAGTITFSPSAATSYTSASLLYGLVVDNTVVETGVWSGSTLSSITNDDGDGMIESVTKSGGTWTWDASVNSKNIPDGPIYLYYVAYDKAGNSISGYVQSSVANSGPKIAKILLGTDLSGDNAYSSSEVSTVYTATSGSEPSTVNLTDMTFKMKGNLAVIPEFVGGNGTLQYIWNPDTTDATAWGGSTYASSPTTSAGGTLTSFSAISVSGTSYSNGIELLTTNSTITAINSALKLLSFSVWDSTDETTIGADSQWALINVPVNVAVIDSVAPTDIIQPFYWKGLTDNSLYGSSSSTTSVSLLNGHIEIPSAATNPAVSGAVSVRGTAFDDQRLRAIYVHIDGMTDSSSVSIMSGMTDSADTTSYPSSKTFGSDTYYLAATFVNGAWSSKLDHYTSEGWAFTASTSSLTQAGHSATWQLDWNTAKINGSAGNGKNIKIVCLDRSTSTTSSTNKPSMTEALDTTAIGASAMTAGETYQIVTVDSSTPTGITSAGASSNTVGNIFIASGAGTGSGTVKHYTNRPAYTVDVVPYIQGVKTSLSTLKKANSSVYDRTALGHYPVRSDQKAYFYGFNLIASATVSDSATAVHTTTLGSADSTTYSGYTVYPAAVSTFTSGAVSITVNSAVSQNNTNDNDAKGSYTGTTSDATGNYTIYSNYYNRQPNNDNNNLLTDDVVLDVWTVKNSARSHSGTLTEPIMRIVPTATDAASTSDVMRFAFTNGADYFSMADASSATNSYQDWQRNYADFNNVAFAYDSEGNSYGITTGLDTYPSSTTTLAGRLTFISSRWGICNTGSMDDNYYGNHKLRLEAIGIMKGANVLGTALADDYIMDTRRFSSPVLATAVHGSGTGTGASTSIYFAYYDKFQKQIRFRYGTFDTSTGTPTQTGTTHNAVGSGGFGQFLDQHAQKDTNYTNNDSSTAYYYQNNKYAFDAALTDYSLIAGTTATTTVVDTGNSAGKYVAIDVVPGLTAAADVVVAVWFDGSNLKYSYKLNPYTDYDADQTHTGGTSGYWAPAQTIFTDGGKYCAIKVDSVGGIHIAAQDSSNQDLKYAYLSSYNAAYSESTNAVTVDSYAIVGTQIQIDTETESGKVIPYISYFNGSTMKPKMAYLVPQTTMNYTAAGADSTTEMLTGKWEVSLVPTASDVQDDHTNIGLWKTKTGVKRVNVAGTNSSSYADSIASATGYSYGNGTANPVVGYATVVSTQGYIETAQKQ